MDLDYVVYSCGAPPACPPPYGPKFSYFHAVFGKIWQICMLALVLDGWRPLLRGILDPPLYMTNIFVTEFTEFCKIYLPVRFKLWVSFSPLQGDHNHPVENNEACNWHSPVSHEDHNGECEVNMTWIFKELRFYTLPTYHAHLQCKEVIVHMLHSLSIDLEGIKLKVNIERCKLNLRTQADGKNEKNWN